MISGRLLPIIGVVAFCSPLYASGEQGDTLSHILDEMVVTATRTPKSIKNVPIVARLINSEDILKSDASNIQDLLIESLPGLEFSYAMSQETSLNMGGFGGSAVLFLVDGERLAGETMDNIDYHRLNLENIGKVEIIKGAASALYGANATGGVVNLITKEGQEPWHADLNSRYRSEGNEWRIGGGLNFNQGKWNSNTSMQYSTVNTIVLTSPFDTQSKIHNVYGGKCLNLNEKLVCHASEGLKVTGRAGYFYRTNERENYADAYHDYSGGLKLNWGNMELSYSYDQYDKSRLIGGLNTHSHDYSNQQHIVHALYAQPLSNIILTFGADYMHDYLASYQFAGEGAHAQSSADAFVQADYSPMRWINILASVRDDYFSESRDNALTCRLAAMFRLPWSSIRTSYSGGFRAPTLKEMYMNFDMAGISMIYGNPDLKPERSHNFSLSLERNGQALNGAYSLTVSGYFNFYHDRIAISDIDLNGPNEDGARYYNETCIETVGADLTASYRSGFGMGLSLSCNYLHMAGNSIDSQFSQPRRWSATWKLDYEHNFHSHYKLYAALSGRYLGKPESKIETDCAYSILKLAVRQGISRGIDITLTADNLLNYRPRIYYWNSPPTTGISWSVGVSFNFNEICKKYEI